MENIQNHGDIKRSVKRKTKIKSRVSGLFLTVTVKQLFF